MKKILELKLEDGSGVIGYRNSTIGFISDDLKFISESEYDCRKYEDKPKRLKEIEDQCVKYNELLVKFHEDYPDSAVDILEMLRRAKLRGRNKTTGETD